MTKEELWEKLELDRNVICFSLIQLVCPDGCKILYTGRYITPENICDEDGVIDFNEGKSGTVEATVSYYVLGENAESEPATDEQLEMISEYFEDVGMYADLMEENEFEYEIEEAEEDYECEEY